MRSCRGGRAPAGRRATLLLSFFVVLALLLAACSSDDGDGDENGGAGGTSADGADGVLRLGMVGPLELDPAAIVVTQSEMIGVDLLLDTLPDIAEHEVTDDQRVWTFTFPDDLVFADGSPIRSGDVKYSLQRVAAPGDQSLRGVRLNVIDGYDEFVDGTNPGISGIKIVDDTTVKITTTEPYAELVELLSDPVFGIVPEGAAKADPDGFVAQPFGSGPFTIDEMTDEGITFSRTEGSDAQVDRVEIVFFDSISDSYKAFEAGDLDWSQVPKRKLDEAAEKYGDGQFVPFHAELWFGMNLGDPMFDDERFREAIVKAIDREAIVEEFYPGDLLLKGIVPQGVPGAHKNACDDRCAHDTADARRLVAAAFPDGDVPTIQLDYSEEDFDRAAAEAIAADLADAGIPTELRPHPLAQYREFVVSSEQQLFLFGWIGIGDSPDTYLGPLFLTGSTDNVTGFSDATVDTGIAAARAFADDEKRLDAYQVVERTIMGQLPIVPLVQLQTRVVISERVEGLETKTNGTFDVEAVTLSG